MTYRTFVFFFGFLGLLLRGAEVDAPSGFGAVVTPTAAAAASAETSALLLCCMILF